MCIIVIYYSRFEASELFLDLLKNLIFALNLNKQAQKNIVWELIEFLVKNRKKIMTKFELLFMTYYYYDFGRNWMVSTFKMVHKFILRI